MRARAVVVLLAGLLTGLGLLTLAVHLGSGPRVVAPAYLVAPAPSPTVVAA